MKLLYLDSSAILKLVVRELETEAMMSLLSDWPERISSVLARAEVMRAARRAGAGDEVLSRAEEALKRIGLVHVDDAVLNAAASLNPTNLSTLEAIHIATALSAGEDLGAVATYDERVSSASQAAGMKTLAPG